MVLGVFLLCIFLCPVMFENRHVPSSGAIALGLGSGDRREVFHLVLQVVFQLDDGVDHPLIRCLTPHLLIQLVLHLVVDLGSHLVLHLDHRLVLHLDFCLGFHLVRHLVEELVLRLDLRFADGLDHRLVLHLVFCYLAEIEIYRVMNFMFWSQTGFLLRVGLIYQ